MARLRAYKFCCRFRYWNGTLFICFSFSTGLKYLLHFKTNFAFVWVHTGVITKKTHSYLIPINFNCEEASSNNLGKIKIYFTIIANNSNCRIFVDKEYAHFPIHFTCYERKLRIFFVHMFYLSELKNLHCHTTTVKVKKFSINIKGTLPFYFLSAYHIVF